MSGQAQDSDLVDVRDRVGAGNRRARISRQLRRSISPAGIALLATIGSLACGAFLVLRIDRTALVSSQRVSFAVRNAAGVVPRVDEVRFRGIPAGKIESVELRGTQPVVTVLLEGKYGTVYRDARAALRPNTPLQDMYLNIVDRGTPGAGRASEKSFVPETRTDTSVSISSVLDVFAGDERARLAHLLDDFGNGMADGGARLRTAFAELVPFVTVAGRITAQLEANAAMTKRLVHNTSVLTGALGDRETSLRRLVDEGAATLTTLQNGSRDLDRVLVELPRTLAAADRSFAAVRGVLPDVDGALTALAPGTARLRPALTDVRRLLDAATPAVRDLRTPVRRLVPLARSLSPAAEALDVSVARLLPQVPPIKKTVDVVAGCLPELNGFFKWDASMAKFGDALGPVPRGNAVAGAQSAGASNPYEGPKKVCAPGPTIAGRPAEEKDKE
ncbi:MlaD family protein [Paraconexibacter sp.]|uniref:MlaD family protein n=1 Tax=Paraconexibacter sp. TaxID=2949640 RepID=UPI00356482DF